MFGGTRWQSEASALAVFGSLKGAAKGLHITLAKSCDEQAFGATR
jgi:hypothetical protein